MNQGAGKTTIGQSSPEALPEAFKGVWKLALWPRLARGSGEVLTEIKASPERGKNRTQGWSVG